MTLKAGITHDVVLHVNNSIECGLTLYPNTFRINNAPTFLPRFSVGDPKGIDRGRWKSWVQDDFSGGAGQPAYSESRANNRYAESNLMDPGTVHERLGMQLAVLPQKMSMASAATHYLFTNQHKIFVVETSLRPFMFHNRMSAVFTNVQGKDPFAGYETAFFNQPRGHWAVVETADLGAPAYSVVKFSTVVHRADGLGILAYDGTSRYLPSYNTTGWQLAVYDNKLWRTEKGRAAFYDTAQAVWSDFYPIGDQDVDILRVEEAHSRLYFGKEDSLWIWDAGRIYRVVDLTKYRSGENFNVLVQHLDALYFNVTNFLYRLSAGNLVERLAIPEWDGVYKDAVSMGDELYLTVLENSGQGRVIIFNPHTGGWRQWFGSDDVAYHWPGLSRANAPTSVATAFGHLFVGPAPWRVGWEAINYTNDSQVAMANRQTPSGRLKIPMFPHQETLDNFIPGRAFLITSLSDMGLPGIDKLFNRVVVTATGTGYGVSFLVKALTQVQGPSIKQAYYYDDAPSGTYVSVLVPWTTGAVEDVLAGVNRTHTFAVGDYIYLAFETPPESLLFRLEEHSGSWFGPPQYSKGSGSWAVIATVSDGTRGLTQSGVMHLGEAKANWKKDSVNAVSQYYWIRMQAPAVGVTLTIYQIEPIGSLYTQEWTELQNVPVNTVAPFTQQQFSAPFSKGTTGKHVAVMIEPSGREAANLNVEKIEIEYLELTQPLDVIDFTVVAVDGLERLDMEVENSGKFVMATLFSLSKSGLLYTSQLPWPSRGYTSDFKLTITPPGAVIPIFPANASFPGTTIPVRLDEMKTESREGWGQDAGIGQR